VAIGAKSSFDGAFGVSSVERQGWSQAASDSDTAKVTLRQAPFGFATL
jgi:hypothetical protein